MPKIVLFEYAKPTGLSRIMNYSAGVWSWVLTPGAITVTDNHGNTGYHEDTNGIAYNVIDVRVDDLVRGYSLPYAQTYSLDDCRAVDSSWYYDGLTTRLYIHFEDFEPPLGKDVFIGPATGFCYGHFSGPYYLNNAYYEPCIKSIGTIKNSIDPLYYGRLKYQAMKLSFINTSGLFDDWRSRNLFGQKTRVLIGDDGDSYSDFDIIHQGFIENDQRSFTEFQVTCQDPRQGLTQPVATRTLNATDWPYLDPSNSGEVYPVRYGTIFKVPCICLNETDPGPPATYTFLLGDTTYNTITSATVYVTGGAVQPPTPTFNYASGTFTLPYAQCLDVDGNTILDQISADQTWPIANGVDIIKDLMYRYDGKNYIASFWDTTEVAIAQALSRNTGVNVDSGDTSLSKVIEDVCVDIDARFFAHDDGTLTIRIYDVNRTPVATIYRDEWMDEPVITNNGSEYLSSAIIKYAKDHKEDRYLTYEETGYMTQAFNTYKKYKNKAFETNLYTLAEATDKAETIMDISSNVSDIITRTTKWQHSNIEIADFVICDPVSRLSGTETLAVYEVMSAEKNVATLDCKFSFRYVLAYTAPDIRIIDTGNFRLTDDNSYRMVNV